MVHRDPSYGLLRPVEEVVVELVVLVVEHGGVDGGEGRVVVVVVVMVMRERGVEEGGSGVVAGGLVIGGLVGDPFPEAQIHGVRRWSLVRVEVVRVGSPCRSGVWGADLEG